MTEEPKWVDRQVSDICPYCHHKHEINEGSSETDEDGNVRFWCARCGKEYRWHQEGGK